MIDLNKEPVKLSLIQLTQSDIKYFKPITALEMFEKGTDSFHPEGLYSSEIFGPPGSKERFSNFSYIDLKLEILHPIILECLNDLKKGVYLGIMAGTVKARFDEEEGDFIKDSTDLGETGYEFFFKHWKKLRPKKNNSDTRNVKIDLLSKYREKGDLRYHYVMPAGHRELEIKEENGHRMEDEINGFYRKIIGAANLIYETDYKEAFDTPRWTIQRVAKEIYDYLMSILDGKRGTIQKKYVRRTTRNGTRNVVTAMDTSTSWLGDPNNSSLKDTEISFIQTIFGALPLTLRGISLNILNNVFSPDADTNEVWLINPKTLKRELRTVSDDTFDRYATIEGRKKLLKRFFNRKARVRPIRIDGYYLGLMYEDDDTFKVLTDIDELPEGYDKKKVTPLTLADVLYVSAYSQYDDLWGTMTRYPITEDGSIFPTQYRVRTTVKSSNKYQLDDEWKKGELFSNFPNRSEDAVWMDSLSPHLSRLDGAGADFDGDTFSSPFLLFEESKKEIKDYFNSTKAYIKLDGSFLASAGNKSNGLVAFNMTRDATISRHEGEQDLGYFA